MIVIATVGGSSIHIVMEIVNETSYRLYYTDAMAEQEMWYLGEDLLHFLNALLTSYGAPYWEWRERPDEFILKVEL